MPIARHTISDLAADELAGLRARGVEPTDAEIVEIHELCKELLSPRTRMLVARGVPIECGGAWLYPLTYAGEAWYSDTGCEFPDPRAALAYAMADGHAEHIERTTPQDVRRWRRSLAATDSEVTEAVAFCLDQGQEAPIPRRPDDGAGKTALALVITAAIGGDPEMWERRVSGEYARAMLDTMAAQYRQEGAIEERTTRATMALGMAVERMVAERTGNG